MRIVSDSGADLSAAEAQALDVVVAPLFIQFPDGEVDAAAITPDEFYDRLAAMQPAIPTTAQPSAGMFAAIYRKIAQIDPDILSIHISSGLSGTGNAARLGGEEVSADIQVHQWDTLTLAGGQRFQVLAAAKAIRAGWSLPAIQGRLAEIRARTEVVFTLETLEYLARGGRIGRVQALAGTLLKIKPIIHVDHNDGKYTTAAKSRTIPGALTTIAEHLRGMYGDTALWVTLQHGRFAEKAEELGQLLAGSLNVAKLETVRISPVLGVHTGPGIVGAAVVPMSLMSDLG